MVEILELRIKSAPRVAAHSAGFTVSLLGEFGP